jgi:hypothetical protein
VKLQVSKIEPIAEGIKSFEFRHPSGADAVTSKQRLISGFCYDAALNNFARLSMSAVPASPITK